MCDIRTQAHPTPYMLYQTLMTALCLRLGCSHVVVVLGQAAQSVAGVSDVTQGSLWPNPASQVNKGFVVCFT